MRAGASLGRKHSSSAASLWRHVGVRSGQERELHLKIIYEYCPIQYDPITLFTCFLKLLNTFLKIQKLVINTPFKPLKRVG